MNSKYVRITKLAMGLNLWFIILAIVYSDVWMVLLSIITFTYVLYAAYRAYPNWKRLRKVQIKWRKNWESGSSLHTTFTDFNIDHNLYYILTESQYRCGFFDIQLTFDRWVYAFDLAKEDWE